MDELTFHPKVVHLPIGLSVAIPLVALLVVTAWWFGKTDRRTWLVVALFQAMLFGSALVAKETGEDEEDRVEHVTGKRPIHEHEERAERFVLGAGVVLALTVAGAALPGERARKLVASAATAGTFAVLGLGYAVGHSGGELVYVRGAASAYVKHSVDGSRTPIAPFPGQREDEEEDDDR
ncbi:MAG: hypothetical protein K8T90_07575 [Planctomycetes bacterium]|nr:hypothetical protein [Planctomycetota bacterium]